MSEDRYTIELPKNDFSGLVAGDWFDAITGATIVGPYCNWPKREPRYFIVTRIGENEYRL